MRDLFWGEFDLAEITGTQMIKKLAEDLYQKNKDDIQALTDLIMVINHKSWTWYELHRSELCDLYAELYYKYYEKAIDYLESQSREDDLTYFIRTLD